jgi:hypothetical protein
MEVEGGLDATIIPYGEAAMAAKKGFNILADLSELMEESVLNHLKCNPERYR